jgi:hypothetical protein
VIDLGSVYQVAVDVVDASGTPVNPDTATLTITLPDDSTVTPAVPTPTTVGQLRVNYVTTQVGRHLWRMVTTNPITAYADVFDVRDQAPVAIVSLADTKKQLNIDATDTGDDDELRGFITGASLAVERELGNVVARRSFTERRTAVSDGRVLLSNEPVLAVTSAVSADGSTTWALEDLDVDDASGLVAAKSGAPLSGDVDFTYTAGLRIVPDDYQLATLIVVQHLWETQRGRYGAVPGGSTEPEYMSGRGFALPRRALELLDTSLPGIA